MSPTHRRPPSVQPVATYRLQLEPERLDFAAAAQLVPYLAELGISHVYCSPVLEAREGSTHGYDVVDPGRVRAALGGEDGLRALSEAARGHGMGLLVDFVPNHVGAHAANPLWDELLATGRRGPAARFFDVNWDHPLPGAGNKVVLPVLGAPYGEILHGGELAVHAAGPDVRSGGPRYRLRYHEHDLPIAPETERLVDEVGGAQALGGTPGEPHTWDRLHALLEAQHYRLVHWVPGGALVNYRRFFSIDDLPAVRVEDPEVFRFTHETIVRLVREGVVDGLRIDHPDGLRDPRRYFERLADATGGIWTLAEKILESGEALPEWPVAGTTGYEFAGDALGLFVEPDSRPVLDELDRAFGGTGEPFAAGATRAKREILAGELSADADRLARLLWALVEHRRDLRDVALSECGEVVRRTVQALEVYRTYVDPETGQASDTDVARLEEAVAAASGTLPDGTESSAPARLYRALADVLLGRLAGPKETELRARFPQLSSAAMAKGVEDTQLYRHRRLLAVNEVGGDPTRLGRSVATFHEAQAARQARHPAGMLTTATHDTKRGEDVRLRIAALSERADLAAVTARRWHSLNAWLVTATDRGPAPDPPTELLLYQTLVAVWPLESPAAPSDGELRQRLVDYAIKASREAKERTSWHDPDPEFEEAVAGFVAGVLDPARSSAFLASLAEVAGEVGEIAMTSGLAQTLLRVTSPGVPDTYQGTELWGDDLVDPDNRRPVDFDVRRRLLAQLRSEPTDPAELLGARSDGRAKLWVLWNGLQARRRHPEAFGEKGAYVPVPAAGRWADHVVAYGRNAPSRPGPLMVVPRLPGRVMAAAGGLAVGDVWDDTVLPSEALPTGVSGWRDLLTGATHDGEDSLPLARVLATWPVALLEPVG